MEIDLGADIIGSDGEKLGVVDSLVVDPDNGTIRAVVVRKGFFFPTDRIIPAQVIRRAEGKQVHVELTKDDIDQLTEYVDTAYLWPPAGYYGHYGYLWPATSVYTTELLVDEEIHERMPDAVILSEGTLVVDRNGEDLGRITEIAHDERGRVAGFRVEEGFFRHHERYIPAHVVAAADDALVQLRVTKDELEQIAAATSPRLQANER